MVNVKSSFISFSGDPKNPLNTVSDEEEEKSSWIKKIKVIAESKEKIKARPKRFRTFEKLIFVIEFQNAIVYKTSTIY